MEWLFKPLICCEAVISARQLVLTSCSLPVKSIYMTKMSQLKMIGIRIALALTSAICLFAPLTAAAAGQELHTGNAALLAVQAQLSTAAKPQRPVAIPLANVAIQAAKDQAFLDSIDPLGSGDAGVQGIQRLLPSFSAQIDHDMAELRKVLQLSVSLGNLQALEQLWASRQLLLTEWQNALTARADQLQSEMLQLAAQKNSWDLTSKVALSGKAPAAVVSQIDSIRTAILNAIHPLDTHRGSVLVLQESVVRQQTLCVKALALIKGAQKGALADILKQDSEPLWSLGLFKPGGMSPVDKVGSFIANNRVDFITYFSWSSRAFVAQMGLFTLLAIICVSIRRRIDSWKESTELPPDIALFEAPFSAALAVALFIGSSPLMRSPQAVRMIMSALTIVPMILLVQTMVNRRPLPLLYVLGLLIAADIFRPVIAGVPVLEHLFLLSEAVCGIAILLWWQRNSATQGLWLYLRSTTASSAENEKSPEIGHFEKNVAWLIILIQGTSFAAVIFGYLHLARLLMSGVLVASTLALALFVFVQMLNGIVAISFRSWPLMRLHMVSSAGDLLERRINKILVWVASIIWFERSLDYIGLLNSTVSFCQAVLSARLQRAEFSISLGDVAAFGLTVWLAFLLASFTCFVLNNDLFPRTKTSTGASYAISSLLRYLIILAGFMVGMGELGIGLNRVVILISAFGVGIGFGLQNIVSNFISGLILLFERPVHIGDTVEFGTVIGDVCQIGIRSSKVRTHSGAIIIVPNSHLITEQVTNWTFSDRLRRIDLAVGVNYGSEPRKVIDLMEAVARANSQVILSPAPACFLINYGDNSVNYELRVWTDQFSDWFQIRSDLAVALYDALLAAGMSFPFPQREVRLVTNDATPTLS